MLLRSRSGRNCYTNQLGRPALDSAQRAPCHRPATSIRTVNRFVCAGATLAILLAAALTGCSYTVPATHATADRCTDIEVVFARGTGEAPGPGAIGGPFIDSLRKKVGARSVGAYAVNYPASTDFTKAADGANDASAHVQQTVANCPDTKIVLGGFSQGAAVIDLITAVSVPMYGFTAPMPPQVADHVAAVAVFGNPSIKWAGGPLTELSPLYGPKTIDLCIPYDPICSDGGIYFVHGMYLMLGWVEEATNFVAKRL
jgi:cutinase